MPRMPDSYQSCPDSDNWQCYQAGWRVMGREVMQTTVTSEREHQFAQRFNEAKLGVESTGMYPVSTADVTALTNDATQF